MLTAAQIEAYLRRLQCVAPAGPTVEALRGLHRAHLHRVPFENLDIHLGRRIVLEVDALVAKVSGDRGGFCYELNGAFAALLEALGYRVARLEARVPTPGNPHAPETPYDHLCLRVEAEGAAWLVDVGFGACFAAPLPLVCDVDHVDPNGTYRLTEEVRDGVVWWLLSEDGRPQYRFRHEALPLSAFAPGCDHHQTSPESHFTQNPVCTLATERGRVTLRGDRLIETVDGTKTERVVPQDQRLVTYRARFGMRLPRLPGAPGAGSPDVEQG